MEGGKGKVETGDGKRWKTIRVGHEGTLPEASPSIAKVRIIRRLHMCANRKLGSSKQLRPSGPTYTPLPYDGGESTSIPPASPNQDVSSVI